MMTFDFYCFNWNILSVTNSVVVIRVSLKRVYLASILIYLNIRRYIMLSQCFVWEVNPPSFQTHANDAAEDSHTSQPYCGNKSAMPLQLEEIDNDVAIIMVLWGYSFHCVSRIPYLHVYVEDFVLHSVGLVVISESRVELALISYLARLIMLLDDKLLADKGYR